MERRCYGKGELAAAYSPEVSPGAALKRLNRWMAGDAALREALRRAGYVPSRRLLTARQAAVLFEYLGEP